MPPCDNQRRFTRFQFDARVQVWRGQEQWEARLRDISLNGALLTVPHGWKASVGESVRLDMHTAGSAVVIRMEAEVARQGSEQVGFRCKHIDRDSIGHLRRLVELNLGDPARLHRELHALGSQE